jgi:hypothetical protein
MLIGKSRTRVFINPDLFFLWQADDEFIANNPGLVTKIYRQVKKFLVKLKNISFTCKPNFFLAEIRLTVRPVHMGVDTTSTL